MIICTSFSGKLKVATRDDEVNEYTKRISQLFSDAEETLEQIELESHNQDSKAKEKTQSRITSYKRELDK
jgi:uncharacterized protein YecA (UPF0149 family)